MANYTCGATLAVEVDGADPFPVIFPFYFGPTVTMTSSAAAWVVDSALDVSTNATVGATRNTFAAVSQAINVAFDSVVGRAWLADAALPVEAFSVPFPYTFPFVFDSTPVDMSYGQWFVVDQTATVAATGTLSRGQPLHASQPVTVGTTASMLQGFEHMADASLEVTALRFGPAVPTEITLPITGLSAPQGICVDEAGDTVYVADFGNNQVVEYTSGVQTTVPLTGTGSPVACVVDSSGALYLTNYFGGTVFKYANGVQTTLGFSGLSAPYGIAVDTAGAVYVANYNTSVVSKLAGGVQTTLPFTGLVNPIGLAVDSAGNVYVGDSGNARVVKLTPGGIQSTLPITGLVLPRGLTCTPSGDVYVGDGSTTKVLKYSNGVTTVLPFSGMGYPCGVGVDEFSNVYVIDYSNAVANELEIPPEGLVTTTRNAIVGAELPCAALPYRFGYTLPFTFWEPASVSWGTRINASLQAVLDATTAMIWDGSLVAQLHVTVATHAIVGFNQLINAALPVTAHIPVLVGHGQSFNVSQAVSVEVLGGVRHGMSIGTLLPITVITDVTTPDITSFWPFFGIS